MSAYWFLFTLTITAILFCWRRAVVRERMAARARDMARRSQPTRLVVFPRPTLFGLTEAELMAAIRARAEAEKAAEVAELERMWSL